MTKAEIRKQIKLQLKEELISEEVREKYSKDLCEKIISSIEYKNADLILGFVPLKSEVNIFSVLENALKNEKQVAVPKVLQNTSYMDFYYLLPEKPLENQLKKGSFGILEPEESLEKLSLSEIQICSKHNVLILVPGLAFTKTGNRLGRGKGFYDIFMSSFEREVVKQNPEISWKKMGICFPFQILPQLPLDDNDINVDSVVF